MDNARCLAPALHRLLSKEKTMYNKEIKKVFLVTVLLILSVTVSSQDYDWEENPDDLDEYMVDDKISVIISTNYNLSYLNFSTRFKEDQSILTWRDMYLHGGILTGEIGVNTDILNRLFFNVGFAMSFNGNWMDDDSHNNNNLIAVTDSGVVVFDLGFALGSEEYSLTKKFGFEYSILAFANYNARFFSKSEFSIPDINGTVALYNQNMIRLFASAKSRLLDTSFFYADLEGLAGLTFGICDGNWLYRNDLEHPESFTSFGLFFHAGGIFEIGFKIKILTLFMSIQGDYEISPWLTVIETHYKNRDNRKQSLYQELSHALFNIGLNIKF